MHAIRKNKHKVSFSPYADVLPFSPRARLRVFSQIIRKPPLALPWQYWIEITNQCNLRCVMCPAAKGLSRKTRTMSFDEFKHIIDQIYMNRPSILLHVAGEPLMNPDVVRMIDYAKSKGCWVGTHTNATLLSKETSQALLATKLDLISFSFDGSSAEVYEKIRMGANFEKVKAQIELFLQLRQEKDQKRPVAKVQILNWTQTRGEIDKFIDYWKRTSIDCISIRPAGNWLGAVDCVKPSAESKFGHRPCMRVFYKCAILVDGTVVPCCRDMLGRSDFGNVFEKSIDLIWNGQLFRDLRLQHLRNSVPIDSICYKCDCRQPWSRSEQFVQWLLKQFFWKNV